MEETLIPALSSKPIPVTVFTGFLGAGKTTLIFNIIKQMPKDYNIVLLKNEFGDVEVDSQLAVENDIQVTEMLNGCLCCVLVGQMSNALKDIRDNFNPDRIIIETSGSAFPAPIAWQIRELKDEGFVLDAIATVIDCVNFRGYEDTSYTAKMQAKYTDIIIMNKSEEVSERDYDLVLDHVNELNTDTPKIKSDRVKGVSPDVVFGLDTILFENIEAGKEEHKKECAIIGYDHHKNEVEIIQVIGNLLREEEETGSSTIPLKSIHREEFEAFLKSLPGDQFYRIKGILPLVAKESDSGDPCKGQFCLINCAFGRFEITELKKYENEFDVRLTFMGESFFRFLKLIREWFGFKGADIVAKFDYKKCITYHKSAR